MLTALKLWCYLMDLWLLWLYDVISTVAIFPHATAKILHGLSVNLHGLGGV